MVKLAAENGLAEAQSALGYHYFIGEFLKKDIEKAKKLWELAAEKGEINAKIL